MTARVTAGPSTIDVRFARRRRALLAALVVAAATTLVTGLAHSLGGGAAPDALLLATAFVLTLLVLAPMLGSCGSVVRQGAAVAVAQLVQHGLYSLPEAAAQAAAPTLAGHGAPAHEVVGWTPAAAIIHQHASMPLAHVVTGTITLALLRLVPRAVATMLEAMSLRRAVAALVWAPGRAHRRASVTAVHPARRRALDVLHAALVTRGPPPAFA